jgi:hypothetical protein
VSESETKVYGPVALPSGRQVTFRLPTGLDRQNLTDALLAEAEDEGSFNVEMLGAQLNLRMPMVALISDDGAPVTPTVKDRMNDWDERDQDAFVLVYREMTNLTPGEAARLRKLAKSLRGGARPHPVGTGQ